MPRTLIRAHRDEDRDRSLGWLAVAWVEYLVRHGPGDVQGRPVSLTDEYVGFVVDCYMVGDSPSNNHLIYDSAFLSRPKGTNKSGLGAYLVLFEALGPCRFAGWAEGGERYVDPWGLGFVYEYQAGEPMGAHPTAPMVRCMATESEQTGNVFDTVHYNLTDDECPLFGLPGVTAGVDKILLPWGGDVRVSTASSSSKDGGKETFVVFACAPRTGSGGRRQRLTHRRISSLQQSRTPHHVPDRHPQLAQAQGWRRNVVSGNHDNVRPWRTIDC